METPIENDPSWMPHATEALMQFTMPRMLLMAGVAGTQSWRFPFRRGGTPKSLILKYSKGIFHHKPTILGILHFRKPPYGNISSRLKMSYTLK